MYFKQKHCNLYKYSRRVQSDTKSTTVQFSMRFKAKEQFNANRAKLFEKWGRVEGDFQFHYFNRDSSFVTVYFNGEF